MTTPPKNTNVSDSRIDAVNKNLKLGILSLEEARKQINQIKDYLYENEGKLRGNTLMSSINYKALDSYMSSKYGNKNKVMDFKAAYNESRRALEALGDIDIYTATQAEIMEKIVELDINKQKRVAHRLTSILKVIGRTDILLSYGKQVRKRVSHVSKEDLEGILKYIRANDIKGGCKAPQDYASLIAFLFSSGCRIGEALALSSSDLNKTGSYLTVISQRKQDGKIAPTKTGVERRVALVPDYKDLYIEFLKMDKTSINRFGAAKGLTKITKLLFPKELIKHISLHGLRHSYAIYLLNNGVSLKSVALCIGDSIRTTEAYYIDFIEDEEALLSTVNKLKRD